MKCSGGKERLYSNVFNNLNAGPHEKGVNIKLSIFCCVYFIVLKSYDILDLPKICSLNIFSEIQFISMGSTHNFFCRTCLVYSTGKITHFTWPSPLNSY